MIICAYSCANRYRTIYNSLRYCVLSIKLRKPVLGLGQSGIYRSYIMNSEIRQSKTFSLDDYDVIGFDLDNTLVRYHLKPLSQLIFQALTKFLVEEKSYPPELGEDYDATCDFYLKGILLDKERGNFLRLSSNHVILKATHGTQPLTNEEIERIYGQNRVWEPTVGLPDLICQPKPNQHPFFLFRDYFVIPVPYIIARTVDLADYGQKNASWSKPYSCIWDDTLEGVAGMYQRDAIHDKEAIYFSSIIQCPSKYLVKCSDEMLTWLKDLGKKKRIFILTSSHIDITDVLLTYCIGPDWREYFDDVFVYARKPGFFNANRPFMKLNGAMETGVATTLARKKVYSQGNWQELKAFFGSSGKEPRVLYVGDSIIDDVLCPSTYTSCHTVAIVEEMDSEGMKNIPADHPAAEELTSKFWGSFFGTSAPRCSTLLDETIRSNARIAVPHLSTLTQLALTQRIPAFSNGNACGYYPAVPLHLVCEEKS